MPPKVNRRSVVARAAAAAATLPRALQPPGGAVATAASGRPNVLIVIMDDMRASDWQALPRMRALVGQRGRNYPNFILNTPVCGPSRATLFTGKLPHNHGVEENDEESGSQAWRAMNNGLGRHGTLHYAAQRAGYRTGLAGKFLNGAPVNGLVSPGLDRWYCTSGQRYVDFTLNENGDPVKYEGKSYSTDVLAKHAIDFIQTTPKDKPFLLYFAPKAPKGPSTPSRNFAGDFNGATVERTPAWNEADVSDKPLNTRRRPAISAAAAAKLDASERDRLETLKSVDAAFVRIWRAVRRTGRGMNTIVMVMTDNGYSMGEHRLIGKGQPYDGMVRFPMMAYGPGFTRGTDERMASMADIAPTLAQAMQIDMGSNLDGASLFDSWSREFVPIETPGTWMPFMALRGRDALYVEYYNGEREYYDYQTDPWELENLLAMWEGHEPTLPEETASRLARRLAAFRTCNGPGCRGISS
ncbi:MAG: sulfatase-like hydrolase/transferase [Thermomicrobiales bacterium]